MTRRPSDPSVRSVQEDDMPVRPPRRVGRRVAKISLVALASLILLAGLVLGGVALVLTPARLTPLVNEYASRVLNARIGFDTVSLSLVRHFPNVGVRLKGGQIVSRAFEGLPDSLRAEIPAAADTLLRFDEFTLALDLPQLLASRLVVRRIDLRRPRVYAYVAPSGRANWEIYAADTVSSENDTVSASDFYLHVARLTVHDTAHIVYDSRPDRTKAELDLNMLSLKGTSGQTYRIDWESRGSVRVDTLDFCRDLPVSLHGGFAFDTRRRGGILTLEFDENGRLQFKTEALEADARYDEIGSGLKIKQLQQDKKELLESLEMYYKVFFLGDIPEEELKKTSGSED